MQVGWNDGLMEVLPVYVTSYICSTTSGVRRYGTLLVGMHTGGRSIFAIG